MRVFLDFESFYDVNYSLRKLSPVEYILDRRWETLGCAVAIDHEDPFLLPRDDIKRFLSDIEGHYSVITHNALFDACVLAYHYKIHPSALFCTLSMSRALIYHKIPNGRLSLKNILDFLGLPGKHDFIQKMSGKHFLDLGQDPGLMMAFTGYALNDVIGCREIFFRLRKDFPAGEAIVMDRVIRMATQPVLHVNIAELDGYRAKIREHKKELLARVTNGDTVTLMSNQKFAAALEALGVDPPLKVSPTTGKQTYAFARTDQAFVDLLDHDDPDVQTLVAARIGIKTTIEETRSTRLINIGECANGYLLEPLLPIPLKYSGAHTHRFSGDWQLNMQNLSARKSKEIRKAIVAPPGYTIVAVDASQIEARLTAWLAGQADLLDQFARGEDTYKAFAAKIFHGGDITLVSKAERFVGKTCILGLGFGMSSGRLYYSIRTLAREQGIEIEITPDDCDLWVQVYRDAMQRIKSCWYDLDRLINSMMNGVADGWGVGPCKVEGTTIILPTGLKLYYDKLRLENNEYVYSQAQFTKKIYGAKLLENIVQALDRVHVVEAGLRTEKIAREMGLTDPRVLLNVHDENVYCVPDEEAKTLARIALTEMRTNHSWSDGLPLAAEVKMGKNFGEMFEWTDE